MRARVVGFVGLGWTVFFGVYMLLWLCLFPFFWESAGFRFFFPSPLVAFVAAAGALMVFVSTVLWTIGGLMIATGIKGIRR